MNRRKPEYSLYPHIICFLLVSLCLPLVPSAAFCADFTLLYSNDIRGETEPCG